MYIREVEESDLDFIASMRGDPDVMRYYPKCLTREESMELIQRIRKRYEEDGHHIWLALDRDTDKPVGTIGLLMQMVDGETERVPEIGYMFAKENWHKGLATEAALAVKEHAFTTLDYPFVISLIRPVNLPSQAVAKRLGMTPWKTSIHADLEHIVFRVDRDA